MKHLFAFLAAAVLVSIPACKQSEAPAKTEFQIGAAPDPTQETSSAPKVELLDPGQEPRQTLRYRFQAGQTETMVMTNDTSLTMSGMQNMQMKMPRQQITMRVRVDEIKPTGEIAMSSEISKLEILNTPGVPPQVTNAVRQRTRQLAGMTSTAVQTDRGIVLSSELDVPDTVTGQMREVVQSFASSAEQASTILPEEPVGVGGKWSVTQTLDLNGMKINQTATYTITELSEQQVKLDVKVAQSAPSQRITAPGQTQSVEMESYTGSGEGTMVMELAKIVPTSDLRIRNTNVVSTGGPKKLTTKGDLRMRFSPK